MKSDYKPDRLVRHLSCFFESWRNPAVIFAVLFFVIAVLVQGYREWTGIDAAASSTAAIGYLFVPLLAVILSLPYALFGFALGAAWLAACKRTLRHTVIALLSLLLALSVAFFMIQSKQTQQRLFGKIQAISTMNDAEMNAFLDNDADRNNVYLLGAIAMNQQTGAATLYRIASLNESDLHKAYGGDARLMLSNRKGLAVMRLVIAHPNVSENTLTLLSASPNSYVLGDVAGASKTPRATLRKLFDKRREFSDPYLIDWGLSYNSNTPNDILQYLAKNSDNEYTLRNIQRNKTTDVETRELTESRLTKRDYQFF